MLRGAIIKYEDMAVAEGQRLQRGMNFNVTNRGYSIILMSVRKDAPYADETTNDGKTIIYEGHDVQKNYAPKDAVIKNLDQPYKTPSGTLTENGKFFDAALAYKNNPVSIAPRIVKVYEKIEEGIWVYKGFFSLTDAWIQESDGRKVFKFKLEMIEDTDTPAGFLPKVAHTPPIAFDDTMDDIAVSEDGKQLHCIEEAKLKKEHYKYEGRLKASQIKSIKDQKGYTCEACGMSFARRYPGLGEDFIECHHKIPYSNMKEGETRSLDINDFMVLCSNCHKMIHRLNDPADLDQLKEILKKGN